MLQIHINILGVVFNTIYKCNENMFRDMVKYTIDKGLKASFACLRKCSSIGYVTSKIGLRLFDEHVVPVLEYASDV